MIDTFITSRDSNTLFMKLTSLLDENRKGAKGRPCLAKSGDYKRVIKVFHSLNERLTQKEIEQKTRMHPKTVKKYLMLALRNREIERELKTEKHETKKNNIGYWDVIYYTLSSNYFENEHYFKRNPEPGIIFHEKIEYKLKTKLKQNEFRPNIITVSTSRVNPNIKLKDLKPLTEDEELFLLIAPSRRPS